MTSYNKNDLAIIANQTGFLRDQLEKVIRLTEILRFFHDDTFLRQSLALKGGTAVQGSCYFATHRSAPYGSVENNVELLFG